MGWRVNMGSLQKTDSHVRGRTWLVLRLQSSRRLTLPQTRSHLGSVRRWCGKTACEAGGRPAALPPPSSGNWWAAARGLAGRPQAAGCGAPSEADRSILAGGPGAPWQAWMRRAARVGDWAGVRGASRARQRHRATAAHGNAATQAAAGQAQHAAAASPKAAGPEHCQALAAAPATAQALVRWALNWTAAQPGRVAPSRGRAA